MKHIFRILLCCVLMVGCGTPGVGIFANSPLDPGIYSGTLDVTVTAVVNAVPQTLYDTILWDEIISENGLPISEGKEARQGLSQAFELGGYTGTETITSIVASSNGLTITTDLSLSVWGTVMTGNVSYTLLQTNPNAIEVHAKLSVAAKDYPSSMHLTAIGTLTK